MSKKERVRKDLADLKAAARRALNAACREHRELSDEIAALEIAKKESMARIKAIIKKHRLDKIDTISAPEWQLIRGSGTNRTLSKEALLQKGVSLKIIDAATTEKPYSYYQVREADEANGG